MSGRSSSLSTMPTNRPQYGSVEEFRATRGAKWTPLQKFVEGGAPGDEPSVLAEVVMSTAAPDRVKDTVSPAGWTYRNFLNNPVLMWCHDYTQKPVGKVSSVAVEGDRFMGRRLVFVPREIDAFAASVGAMYLHPERFLRMFSVGFMPEDADFNQTTGGIDFKRQDLLELSACPIGMHPDALVAARSARIDVAPWMELAAKSLDGDNEAPQWMVRDFATMVHRSLAPVARQVPDISAILAAEQAKREAAEKRIDDLAAELAAVKQLLYTPQPAAIDYARALDGLRTHFTNRTADVISRFSEE